MYMNKKTFKQSITISNTAGLPDEGILVISRGNSKETVAYETEYRWPGFINYLKGVLKGNFNLKRKTNTLITRRLKGFMDYLVSKEKGTLLKCKWCHSEGHGLSFLDKDGYCPNCSAIARALNKSKIGKEKKGKQK